MGVHSSSMTHCNRRGAAPRAPIAAKIGSLDAPENYPLGWKHRGWGILKTRRPARRKMRFVELVIQCVHELKRHQKILRTGLSRYSRYVSVSYKVRKGRPP